MKSIKTQFFRTRWPYFLSGIEINNSTHTHPKYSIRLTGSSFRKLHPYNILIEKQIPREEKIVTLGPQTFPHQRSLKEGKEGNEGKYGAAFFV